MSVKQILRWFQGGVRRRPAVKQRRPLLLEALEERWTPAVPSVWLPRGLGGGGALYSPQFNPANANEIYISSDMSNLFHSTDQGASWSDVDFRQIQGNHETAVQFTNNPLIRYALDYTSIDGGNATRPKKSTDGGATWQFLASDPTEAEAFRMFVDYNNPNRVVLSNYGTLFFSSNGGQSFAQRYQTNDNDSGLHLAGAFFDGANIYVGTNQGLLASSDGGQSFNVANLGGIPSTERMLSFAGAKQNGVTRFFLTTGSGVYAGIDSAEYWLDQSVYTLDVGQSSWVKRMSGIDADGLPVFVAMATNDISTAYLGGGSMNGDPTVYKTSNGGQTWQSVLLTANNQNVKTGWAGAGGDRQWSYGETALGFTVNALDSSKVIITDYGFAHLSTDGGASWRQINTVPADLNPAGAATPQGRNYRSTGLDNTTSWGVTWIDANHLVAAQSDIRGAISGDAGQSWSLGYTGHTQNSLYRSVVQGGIVYAATATVHDLYQSTYLLDSRIDGGGGKVIFSSNQGKTWQTLHDFAHPVIWVATDPTNANRLYASVIHSTQGGIYVTNNLSAGAASTWTKLTNPPRTEGHPFNIVVLNDGTLVVTYSARRNSSGTFTASSGIYVSTNGGQTWQDRSDPNMQYWTKDVIVDPNDATQNTWYVGVWSGWGGAPNNRGGLYRTTDRGLHWTRLNTFDRVTSLTINPLNPNEAYLTTEEAGLWVTSNLNATLPTFTQVANYTFMHPERVVFNPFNPNEIWVTSFGGGLRVGYQTAQTPAVGTLQFSAPTYSVGEAGGTIAITVNRVGGSGGAVGVSFATGLGTATPGSDYTAATGNLSWADGDSSAKTFTLSILNDQIVEGSETLPLTLSNPTGGATLGTSSATLTIVDDDQPPAPAVIQFGTSTYSVAENGGSAAITVSRTGNTSSAVTVTYATSNGSAAAGSDYTTVTNTLTFGPNETQKTFTISILDNALVESNETVNLTLSNPTGGATLGTSTATLTIVDNDVAAPPASVVKFAGGSYGVVEQNGTATILVLRSGDTSGTTTVNYATAGGTATAGSDYLAAAGQLTFKPGETYKGFTISQLDDTLMEGIETLTMTLSNASGGQLGSPSTATLTIFDNDAPAAGRFSFSASTYSVAENGGPLIVAVRRTDGSAGAVSVKYTALNGTATVGADFSATTGLLNFAAGETQKTFSLPILDDVAVEGNETLTLALSNAAGGATLASPATAVVTIVDNDVATQPAPFQFAAAQDSTNESWGYTEIYVNRTGNMQGTYSVSYATGGGTTTAGSDYTAAAGTLTFGPGVAQQMIRIYLTNDVLLESPETIQVTLTNPTSGAVLGTPAAVVITVADDEINAPGNLQFSDSSYTTYEGWGYTDIPVWRAEGTVGPVAVNYTVTAGTAQPGVQYQPISSGTLTFASGSGEQVIRIYLIEDLVPRGATSLTVSLSNPTGGAFLGARTTAMLTIIDNDL